LDAVSSITTDGTIGLLGPNNFTSWTWTVTNPTETFTATYKNTDPGAAVAVEGNVVMATGTSLLLLGTGTGELEFGEANSTLSDLEWVRNSDVYVAYVPNPGPSNYPWVATPPIGYGSGVWTIASVPEPSSIVLGGLGTVCGIAYGLARKRRAQRKARNEP